MTGTDPSEKRDMVTTICYSSCLIKLTNHIIIKGGGLFFDLSTLKVAVLVNCSVITVHMFLFL